MEAELPQPGDTLTGAAADYLSRMLITVEESPEAIFWMGESGSFVHVNRQACASLGYTREELLGLKLWDIDPDFPPDRWAEQWKLLAAAGRRTVETRHRRRNGEIFPVEVCACHLTCCGDTFHVAFVRDISSRVRNRDSRNELQVQLQQAQRLEAVGRLAGGIAHDFNNMLSVIIGYTEQLLEQPGSADLRADLRQIDQAARRSASLTRQLLAFARKQTIEPRNLDLNTVVADLLKMLGRLMGAEIALVWRPEAAPALVHLDPSQIDQILANLCVNARDAITGQGTVVIETANRRFDAAYCAEHPGAEPGDYIMLAVSDDGCGIAAEALPQVFEPFYTTKGPDEGTGLGLAMVYGIVRQNGGIVQITSEEGRGTTVRIHLPAAAGSVAATSPGAAAIADAPGGNETILVVEDEAAILLLCRRQLVQLGYRVLAIGSPAEALALAAAGEEHVDLLLTDVVMPSMNGSDLAGRLSATWPHLRTLFMSGYTANAIAHQGVLEPGVHFLAKPYTRESLARAVRRVLGEPAP
ncbi:response regulator [bacterium]|nr:response regulator [bacterium]